MSYLSLNYKNINHLSNAIGTVEQIFESTIGRNIDDNSAPLLDHDPASQRGADIMISQAHTVDRVPGFDRVSFPKLLSYKDKVGF